MTSSLLRHQDEVQNEVCFVSNTPSIRKMLRTFSNRNSPVRLDSMGNCLSQDPDIQIWDWIDSHLGDAPLDCDRCHTTSKKSW